MIRNNVKVLYKFITENVDVNEVADESIKLQLKEDVFSEHPEFKREIKFLMDNWDTFISQVDAVIQLNRNFNTEEEDANNLVDKVAETLGDIRIVKENKEFSDEELLSKGLIRPKRRGFGAGERYEFRDRDGIFTVAPSKEEAIKRVRQVIVSDDVTSLFKKTHPGVVEAKEDPIVIVNYKNEFWTGSSFADEFPEAMLFSTVGKAKKALKFLKDKMKIYKPKIIVNSGLENERVLEAKEDNRTVGEIHDDLKQRALKTDLEGFSRSLSSFEIDFVSTRATLSKEKNIENFFNMLINEVKKETETQKKVKAAFKEVKKDEPSIVTKTRKKEGEEAANKQKIAIALSKARKTGAKIPEKPTKESIEDKHVDSSLANDIVVRGFFKDIHFFKPEDLEKIDIDSIVDGIIDEHGFNTGNVALAILSGRDFREQNLGDLEIIQKELKGDLAKQLKGFIEGNVTRDTGELEHDIKDINILKENDKDSVVEKQVKLDDEIIKKAIEKQQEFRDVSRQDFVFIDDVRISLLVDPLSKTGEKLDRILDNLIDKGEIILRGNRIAFP